MPDPVARLNAALEGRYRIVRAIVAPHSPPGSTYVDGDGWMTAAAVATTPDFRVTSRERLFEGVGYRRSQAAPMYDVTDDGQRFVMLQGALNQQPSEGDLVLVRNWFDEVRQALRR